MDRARFGTGLLAGVLVGLLAGWILGSLSRSGGRSAPARPLVETEKRVEGADHEARSELSLSSRSSAHEASREPERPEASTPSDGELISDALREHARAGILRGWSKVRGDVMPEGKLPEALGWVERGIHEGPESIGRHFAELQTKAEQPEEPVESEETERVTPDPIEAFLAHDPIELLDRVEERHDTELRLGLVNDAAGFAQLFPGRAARTLDGRASLAKFDAALEDGTVLDFPSGVFRLRRLRTSDSFPRDVTLRGAGMNGTLLLFGDLSTLGELRNFTLRDCTVFNENGPLFDLRARPASVLVERVRLIGFDCGAGGSVLLYAPGLALLARASSFEGGYGRAPGYANLFRVSGDALLARFENCLIDLVNDPSSSVHGGSVVFDHCALTNLLREMGGYENPAVVYSGSTVSFFSGDPSRVPRKDLNELFPDWEKRIEE